MVLIKNNVFHSWLAQSGRRGQKKKRMKKLRVLHRCLQLSKEDFIIAYFISHQFHIIWNVTKFRSRFAEATNRVILIQAIRKEKSV